MGVAALVLGIIGTLFALIPGLFWVAIPIALIGLILGVVGGFMCILPVLVSPFAWFTGMKARREIRASNGQLAGDGMATAGMVLGIIGTVLLALVLIGIVVLVIVVANDPTVFDEGSTV